MWLHPQTQFGWWVVCGVRVQLLYTTSTSVLAAKRPAWLRPSGPIYQTLDNRTLRARNKETAPFFNEASAKSCARGWHSTPGHARGTNAATSTCRSRGCAARAERDADLPPLTLVPFSRMSTQVCADLEPVSERAVKVKFDEFKLLGLLPIKAPPSAVGERVCKRVAPLFVRRGRACGAPCPH